MEILVAVGVETSKAYKKVKRLEVGDCETTPRLALSHSITVSPYEVI